ncbi:MAG: hypothetical protein F7C08_00585 [Desulfurococcales archaeon]|nr:hypothetical protein [Desulfurococcales archaeon]
MVCPYATNVKGAVAYCTIINKKVSTLKYPCKGNYKRCSIYARRPVKKPAKEIQKPKVEAPPVPAEPRQEETKPIIAEPPKVEPKEPVAPVQQRREVSTTKIQWRPGKAICDSLLLAVLVSVAEAVGVVRGSYRDLEGKLLSLHTNGSFIFIVGRVDKTRVRMVYSSGYVFSMMAEQDGNTICGQDALKQLEPITDRILDLVLYSVSWSSLDKWGDELKKDLEKARKQ